MKVGRKIRILRELLGYTQDFMSIELEISQTTYCRIENECTRVDISMLGRIVNILNISIIGLLQFDDSNIESVVNSCTKQPIANDQNINVYETRIVDLEEKVRQLQRVIGTNGNISN